jgi:hypothetical protein
MMMMVVMVMTNDKGRHCDTVARARRGGSSRHAISSRRERRGAESLNDLKRAGGGGLGTVEAHTSRELGPGLASRVVGGYFILQKSTK